MLASPIGEILIERGLVSPRDLSQALALQAEVGGLLGQALLRLGAITEEQLLAVISEQLDLPIAETADLPPEPEAFLRAADRLKLAPRWFEVRRCAAWLSEDQNPSSETEDAAPFLHVVAADPLDPGMREAVEAAVRRALDRARIIYYLAASPTLDVCLRRLETSAENADEDQFADAARLREMAEEAPVIDFVNALFAGALKENASDIHVEAFEHTFLARYRIDGVLHTRRTEPRARFDAVSSRIKLVAGMDVAERRLPQDGRHTIRFAGREIDLRVSTVPSTWGESLVIRLLRKQTELPDLEGLGLTGRSSDLLGELIACPNGVILVTGPTGSGKSTTLYRGLERINDGFRKIITIEDPVEYDIAGVTQIQVKADIGYTFASGLRAILRQDPDVILVGEIRDGETATIAAQAALTGHLVLSTLHTNSALAAVTRLEDIGLERFLISACVRGLVAQRLVRRVCPACGVEEDGSEGEALCAEARDAGAEICPDPQAPPQWRRAVGCPECDGTGYKGRIAVFEIVRLDDPLREAIGAGASLRELQRIARRQGFLTLFEDGLSKARAGLTTLSEIYRVCGGEAS